MKTVLRTPHARRHARPRNADLAFRILRALAYSLRQKAIRQYRKKANFIMVLNGPSALKSRKPCQSIIRDAGLAYAEEKGAPYHASCNMNCYGTLSRYFEVSEADFHRPPALIAHEYRKSARYSG